ncbi:UNVERIFIED_CONTAM: hypothetical protein ACS92_07035 [Bacillus cereus]
MVFRKHFENVELGSGHHNNVPAILVISTSFYGDTVVEGHDGGSKQIMIGAHGERLFAFRGRVRREEILAQSYNKAQCRGDQNRSPERLCGGHRFEGIVFKNEEGIPWQRMASEIAIHICRGRGNSLRFQIIVIKLGAFKQVLLEELNDV